MPRRPSKASEKKKVTLNLSNAVNERIDELRDLTEADSITEVIRRSIAVYDHLCREAKENNAEVLLKFPNGDEKYLLLK